MQILLVECGTPSVLTRCSLTSPPSSTTANRARGPRGLLTLLSFLLWRVEGLEVGQLQERPQGSERSPSSVSGTVLGARTLIFSEIPLPPGQALSSLSPRGGAHTPNRMDAGYWRGPSHREVPRTHLWGGGRWSGGCVPFSPDSSLPRHPRSAHLFMQQPPGLPPSPISLSLQFGRSERPWEPAILSGGRWPCKPQAKRRAHRSPCP